jgi:para-aminobenzoate synthetase/4-amino-4-deoxychorismate lyase
MRAGELESVVHRDGTCVLQTGEPPRRPEWTVFRDPRCVLETTRVSEVSAVLEQMEHEVARGRCAAGFIAYEAAPAFDHALQTRPAEADLPLIWFGIYDRSFVVERFPDEMTDSGSDLRWCVSQEYGEYERTLSRLHDQIARGNTYQVNYTIRLHASFGGDPWPLFLKLCRAQRARYSAYLHTGQHTLCSVSPELFFEKKGDNLICRPMKGTAARGMTTDEDRLQTAALAQSAKDRAENIMIVDMVRNDLGKIAEVGSVRAPDLFTVERYDTVFQMTSTVTALTNRPTRDVIAALFPCASVTGAPKVRSMRIIAEEEMSPRGVYTGCIGYVSSPTDARFSVAIRTVQIDHRTQQAVYGTGGGIVWDSEAAAEYAECRAKAQVLFDSRPPFRLFETIRWQRDGGFFLLEEHIERLKDSAAYFGIPFREDELRQRLSDCERLATDEQCMVRTSLSEDGGMDIETEALLGPLSSENWRVALARQPVDERDRFLHHKTTNRQRYDRARADFPECDDVILWNSRSEITEATRANVVVRKGGLLLTPPVRSGLLAGVFRGSLLQSGQVKEAVLHPEDLARADAVFLVNSLRGWIAAEVVEAAPKRTTDLQA